MSTTILTDEQKAQFVTDIADYGTGFVAPLFAVVESIEQAVLQSPEVQARMEAYAAAKVREALSAAYEKAAQRSMIMPHYSDFDRGYAEGRSHAAMEIREFIPGPVEPTT